jgi:hypothetical protein
MGGHAGHVGRRKRELIYASLESRPRRALHEAAILMFAFILRHGDTQHTLSKLPHLRGGGERDRDSDRLSFTPLPVTPRHSRSGDSLLGSGGRLSLSSMNRPPSWSRSRSRSRSVRRWAHTRANPYAHRLRGRCAQHRDMWWRRLG